jgi:L-amino acid N-acyltransferase
MIRLAKEQDLPWILEIYNEAIINTAMVYESNSRTIVDQLAWLSEKQAAGLPVLVYTRDGKVSGFATFGPYSTMSGFRYTVKDSIYVHKGSRRKHIGTALLKSLMKMAGEYGYATMIAEIDNRNEGSKLLHENLDFKNVGTINKAGYKFGEWRDLAVFQCDLADAVELGESSVIPPMRIAADG